MAAFVVNSGNCTSSRKLVPVLSERKKLLYYGLFWERTGLDLDEITKYLNVKTCDLWCSAQVPEAPSGLQAFPLSSTSISLTWNVPRANSTAAVTGYKLYYYDFGDSEAENEATVTGATSYVLRELKKFHQYSFRVVAFNGIGLGSGTEEVVCRTYSDGLLPF